MNLTDDVGTRQDERFVTSEIFRPAEIVFRKLHLHELGAHGSVKDEHAVGEGSEIR